MARWERLLGGLIFAFAVCGALAACARPAGPPGEIRIVMNEYKFDPGTIRIKAGQEVRLVLVNEGKKEHELFIGRNVIQEDGKPAGYQESFFANLPRPQISGEKFEVEEEEIPHGFVVFLEPGGKATVVFTAPTTDQVVQWEMGCFAEDGVHYEEGMRGTLIVEK